MRPHRDRIYSQILIESMDVCLLRYFSIDEDLSLVGPLNFCSLLPLRFGVCNVYEAEGVREVPSDYCPNFVLYDALY
jgi:hypothetical protein